MLQNVPGRCSLMEGKTVIAIAHRLSTIASMGRLLVLDEAILSSEARTMNCLGLAASMQPPGGTKMPGSLEHKIPPQARQDYDGLYRISDKNLLAKMTIATQLDMTSRIT
jgi:hypothetical protein